MNLTGFRRFGLEVSRPTMASDTISTLRKVERLRAAGTRMFWAADREAQLFMQFESHLPFTDFCPHANESNLWIIGSRGVNVHDGLERTVEIRQ